ncbi:uncharacterized protein [Argopecten irradians]|uniref:uncharacterized protein n=1 Tax=Argopecten irradians TaxID=31199 RepID=UPI003711D47E
MTAKTQKDGRRLQPRTVGGRRQPNIKPMRRLSATKRIRPDTMKGITSNIATRSQTKIRRPTHRYYKVSKQIKQTSNRDLKSVDKNRQENKLLITENTEKQNETTTMSEVVNRQGDNQEQAPHQGMSVSVTEQSKSLRAVRATKPDYAQLAGIKRRSPVSGPPFPELPRFARKARRRCTVAGKRARLQDTEHGHQTESSNPSEGLSATVEDRSSLKESQAPCEVEVAKKTNNEHSHQRRKTDRNPLLERDSQQKVRKRLVKNGTQQKAGNVNVSHTAETLRPEETLDDVSSVKTDKVETSNQTSAVPASDDEVVEKSNDSKDDTSCELEYYVTEAQTSPEFVKYFHESRRRPSPDPEVYDWPKEWLPKSDTPLVSADTSALEIDPPKTKPPYHVFENNFYLQSPPKPRSEMERWKFKFDYYPQVEQARLQKIKDTEQRLLAELPAGSRVTKKEKHAIKRQARQMVDTEEYIEKLAKYNEQKDRNMEIMREVYRERNLGEPLDTNDIAEMAMDIKNKVYLKSMRIAYPEHVLVEDNGNEDKNGNPFFSSPRVDTITNEARRATNKSLQESEAALERDLGVVFDDAEIRPASGVNYIYESYKRERNRALDHSYTDSQTSHTMHAEPREAGNDPAKRMSLWFGHKKHRKLQEYERQKYVEHNQNSSNANDSGSSCSKDTRADSCSIGVNGSNYSDEEEIDDVPSQPRMTMWYGHNHNIGEDEDEAVNAVCTGSRKRTFDKIYDDDEEVKEMSENGAKVAEDFTFTRTVPFLQLTTEDIPLRVRTQAYKFQRTALDYTRDCSFDH